MKLYKVIPIVIFAAVGGFFVPSYLAIPYFILCFICGWFAEEIFDFFVNLFLC